MHWVDRGPEPGRIQSVRSRYTPRWVAHYRNQTVPKPSDSRWRDFLNDLSPVFFGLCGYCEEPCRGEVDHFRPKSKFPELVYQWSNWVFACHSCNSVKKEKWPPGGFIDPCARSRSARPENLFDFDVRTGAVKPKDGLSPAQRKKAMQTRDALDLNAAHHLKARSAWIRALERNLSADDSSATEFLAWVTDRSTQLSSIARALLVERGHSP
jgi:uncharacterized protein (TIGR02646 family)